MLVSALPFTPSSATTNQLIDGLPDHERLLLLELCEHIDLTFADVLCEVGHTFEYVYFPLDGFISLVSQTIDHNPLEVGLIGNEGMLGATLVLGIRDVPLRAVVQGSGASYRVPISALRRAVTSSHPLQRMLKRYVFLTMAQLAQCAVCNCFHDVGSRLSRWLLMTHDRAHSSHFQMTQQFLADMLGVQRTAINHAATALQTQGLIHYSRGNITVTDRQGLEERACECYRIMTNNYVRLFG